MYEEGIMFARNELGVCYVYEERVMPIRKGLGV